MVGATAIAGAVLNSGATTLAGKSTGKAAFKLSRAGQIAWDMRKLEKFREEVLAKREEVFVSDCLRDGTDREECSVVDCFFELTLMRKREKKIGDDRDASCSEEG